MAAPALHRLSLRIPNRLDAIPHAAVEIERFCRARGVPETAIGHLNLALDEALTNTISYGWPNGGDHEAQVELQLGDGWLEAELTDDGIAFDPLAAAPPDLDADIDSRRIGGLGVHFLRTLMDGIGYRRDGGRNVLSLRKSFAAGAGTGT